MRGWMGNANSDLNGVPSQMIAQVTGLVKVMNYLDVSRAPT